VCSTADRWNQEVFSMCHNESNESERTLSGTTFQISAVATGKTRLPIVDSFRGNNKMIGSGS